MLRELRVRNFAVIDQVDVEFEPGLNVLTGETGAGKSILIDAILLVRGARAQADTIRTDAESATVEALFDLAPGGGASAILGEAGLDPGADAGLVIRREIARSGRHRAFVNDVSVTVGLLERLGDHLVDVHGQHEHQRLLQPAHQLDLLDRFADTESHRDRVGALVVKHRVARDGVDRLRAADRDRAQREDVLRFQVSEIDAARLRPGEEDQLRTEQRRLKNAERLAAGLADATAALVDDAQSVTARLGHAAHVLAGLARVDPSFAGPIARLEAASAEVDEAARAVRTLRDRLEFEPGRLEAIDDRLDALARLKHKYGDTEDAILKFRDEAARDLERLVRHEELLSAEERMLVELETDVTAEVRALSQSRRSAATRLGAQTEQELRALGMERAAFTIVVEPLPPDQVGPKGGDRVEFRLSANAGEEPRPLGRVASGGELSRTLLALLTVLTTRDAVETSIFDEVDAGVGARVAGVVADKLATVGRTRQVLCVTHLAPIAARASHHLRISKAVRAGRTRATAEVLHGPERVAELARMLAGDDTSTAALRHARELLSQAEALDPRADRSRAPRSRPRGG